MSFFFLFSSLFFAGQEFVHVLGLEAWLRVPAACSWFVPPRCVSGPGPVDVDVDADVDAEADAGRRRRRRRGECLGYTPAGTGKGMNIKDNIKQ